MWEQYKHYGTIRQMVRERLPMTREVYIGLNWPFGDAPKHWTAEDEAEMPEPFRLPSGHR
jgi:hypothetical protein